MVVVQVAAAVSASLIYTHGRQVGSAYLLNVRLSICLLEAIIEVAAQDLDLLADDAIEVNFSGGIAIHRRSTLVHKSDQSLESHTV